MNELKGWLNITKEKGISSHDLVYKVRKALKFKKVGHAGTLDPLATGVMVVAVGKATRLIQFLNETKKYKAILCLGKTTTTLDAEGEILSEKEVNITQEQLLTVINSFVGKITQIPPMYSSVHHNGQRLYELARQGIEVERKERHIEIYSIDFIEQKENFVEIDVYCESGTYIRTLADDIGRLLGCGAYLSYLERTEANNTFAKKDSINIEELTSEKLLPLDYPLQYLPEILLNEELEKKYLHGQILTLDEDKKNGFCRVLNSNKILLGIGKMENNQLIPKVTL